MSIPRYGTKEWISRLSPSLKPIARVNRLVVVRTPEGMLAKVIGGTPEHPTVIGLTAAERLSVIKSLRTTKVGAAPGSLKVTWVDWYNTSATTPQQEVFDEVTKKVDAAGVEGLPGGKQAGIIDSYRYTHPSIYDALLNYRDTGGRRALFAEQAKSYGSEPIARPKARGPMEEQAGNLVLHPGRYTYSDLNEASPFKQWLDFTTKERSVQVLRTQIKEGLLHNVIPIVGPIVATPYYTNYEFLVAKDVLWNNSISGWPTWLPAGHDVQSYWGKPPEPAKPDWGSIPKLGEGVFDFSKQVTTLAVLIGVGYLLMKFAPSSNERAHAR